MEEHLKTLTELREKLSVELSLNLGAPIHIGRRPFSDVYLSTSDIGKQYVIKIEKTSRNIEHEYRYYKLVNDLGINSLVPVYFSKVHCAMVTEKKELVPYYRFLEGLNSRNEYEQSLVRFGEFAYDIEKKTNSVVKAEELFSVHDALLKKLNNGKLLPECLKGRLKTWLHDNESSLAANPNEMSLATDLNFYNVHLDKRHNFVMVDLGDAHFWPKESNLAYVLLQFKFNKLRAHKMDESDFVYFMRGYRLKNVIQGKRFIAFQILHLLSMIEFYKMNSMVRHTFVSKLKAYYDKYIKAWFMERHAISLLK